MQETETKALKKAIVLTLAYHGALNSPLTIIQIDRYLFDPKIGRGHLLSELKNALLDLREKGMVRGEKGFYWIKNTFEPKGKMWLEFIQKEKTSSQKIDLVRKSSYLFSLVPFLRGLFICGSVSRKAARPESDIDFLLLTEKNRVWLVRFCLTFLAIFLGKKAPDSGPRKNKFCLNHYRGATSEKLEKSLQDLYSATEYSQMINIISTGEEEAYFRKNAFWMKSILPNFDFVKPAIYNFPKLAKARLVLEKILKGKLGEQAEKILRKIQIKKISFKSQPPSSSRRLAIKNNVIMFHLAPRAPRTMERFREIVEKLK